MTDRPLIQPVECSIRVNDRELSELYPFVQEVRVEMRRGAATTCSIVVDSVRGETGRWSFQDQNSDIRPMADLSIQACFGNRSEPVMSGLIKEVRLEFPQEMGGARGTIVGQDYSLLLDRERLDETFPHSDQTATDQDLVQYLANDKYNLSVQAARGVTLQSFTINDTAIQVLKKRAQANGFELYVRDKTLYFAAPALDGGAQPTILVYAGKSSNCSKFDVRHDGHQPDQVSVAYAPKKGQEPQIFTASPNATKLGTSPAAFVPRGQSASVWRLESPNGASEEELKTRAQAAANERAFRVAAEGELDGALYGAVLRNMETVTVDGVGPDYSGKYYVADVVHTFTADGYKQHFKLLRNQLGEGRDLDSGATRNLDARAR